MTESASTKTREKGLILASAILSILVLVAHAADAPDHLKEWWGYGTFFVTVAAFQFFLGLAMFVQPWKYGEDGGLRSDGARAGIPYYVIGIALSAVSILVYVITRSTGMAFLSTEAVREPLTILSLAAPIVNVVLVVCFWALIRH